MGQRAWDVLVGPAEQMGLTTEVELQGEIKQRDSVCPARSVESCCANAWTDGEEIVASRMLDHPGSRVGYLHRMAMVQHSPLPSPHPDHCLPHDLVLQASDILGCRLRPCPQSMAVRRRLNNQLRWVAPPPAGPVLFLLVDEPYIQNLAKHMEEWVINRPDMLVDAATCKSPRPTVAVCLSTIDLHFADGRKRTDLEGSSVWPQKMDRIAWS